MPVHPLAVSVCLLTGAARGFLEGQTLVPNGKRVMYNGVSLPAFAHIDWAGNKSNVDPSIGGPLSVFGMDFLATRRVWTRALCAMDSDGDGQSNGLELGDPDCVWKKGDTPARTTDISDPGMEASTTAAAETAEKELPVVVTKVVTANTTSRPAVSPTVYIMLGVAIGVALYSVALLVFGCWWTRHVNLDGDDELGLAAALSGASSPLEEKYVPEFPKQDLSRISMVPQSPKAESPAYSPMYEVALPGATSMSPNGIALVPPTTAVSPPRSPPLGAAGAVERNACVPQSQWATSQQNIFVGNLPCTMNDAELFDMMREFGDIDTCKVIFSNTGGGSQCYGVVKFFYSESARRAVDRLDRLTFKFRVLEARFASPQEIEFVHQRAAASPPLLSAVDALLPHSQWTRI